MMLVSSFFPRRVPMTPAGIDGPRSYVNHDSARHNVLKQSARSLAGTFPELIVCEHIKGDKPRHH
jgi:hypothetical protein